MEHGLLYFAAPILLIIGLSQMYLTSQWHMYYQWLSEQGPIGVRINGLISLAIGGPIVIYHNVWSGPPILLTMLGWLFIMEAALCLFVPGAGLSGIVGVENELRYRIIRGTGVAFIVIGGVLFIHMVAASA